MSDAHARVAPQSRAELVLGHRLGRAAAQDHETQRSRRDGSQVYFIQQGADGPVKIGYARDVGKRLSMLQQGNPLPLRLLAWIPGGQAFERACHQRCAAQRIRGEWFRPSRNVLELASLAKAFGWNGEL